MTPEGTVGTEGMASPNSTLHPQSKGGLGSATQCPVVVYLGRGRNKGWRLSAALKQWGRTPGVTEIQVTARVHALRLGQMPTRTPAITFHPSSPPEGNPSLPRVSGSL